MIPLHSPPRGLTRVGRSSPPLLLEGGPLRQSRAGGTIGSGPPQRQSHVSHSRRFTSAHGVNRVVTSHSPPVTSPPWTPGAFFPLSYEVLQSKWSVVRGSASDDDLVLRTVASTERIRAFFSRPVAFYKTGQTSYRQLCNPRACRTAGLFIFLSPLFPPPVRFLRVRGEFLEPFAVVVASRSGERSW